MKSIIKLGLLGLSLLAVSCAKDPKISNNEQNKNYISAWIHKYHLGLKPSESGLYTILNKEGDSKVYNNEKFVYAEYEIRDLDSNLLNTSNEKIAQQIGTYKPYNYYGNFILSSTSEDMNIGVWQMLRGMKEGGERQGLIPSWLNIKKTYKKDTDYYKHNSKNKNLLYKIKVKEFISDIDEWGDKVLEDYIKTNNLTDLTKIEDGIYFKYTTKANDRTAPTNNEVLRLNYTCYRLDNQAFKTNNEDIALINNIQNFVISNTPAYLQWDNNPAYTVIVEEGNLISLGKGIGKVIHQMVPGDKVRCYLSPKWAFEGKSMGKLLPAYSCIYVDLYLFKNKQ